MIWQDWVFSVGSWIFVIALIPTLRGKDKPAFSTSLITGVILTTFVIAYFSLSLWLSAFSTTLTSLCWLTLAYQKFRQGKK